MWACTPSFCVPEAERTRPGHLRRRKGLQLFLANRVTVKYNGTLLNKPFSRAGSPEWPSQGLKKGVGHLNLTPLSGSKLIESKNWTLSMLTPTRARHKPCISKVGRKGLLKLASPLPSNSRRLGTATPILQMRRAKVRKEHKNDGRREEGKESAKEAGQKDRREAT